MDYQQIWQWTLTKEAIAPCFVRDVLNLRQHTDKDADFFWLGYIPCRTVLLVGMVVAVQAYDKRAIYTIDDGTAVIDCVLRYTQRTVPAHAPRSVAVPNAKPDLQPHSPKSKVKPGTHGSVEEPPPPLTEPGYPVRVVGRVVRHYQSKQIYADSIDLCPSSLDEIAHLEHVIELHKTKYSRAIPFVPPTNLAQRAPPPVALKPQAGVDTDASVFSETTSRSRPGLSSTYTLPAPPKPLPLQNRNRPPPLPTHAYTAYHGHTHRPSSPTASSVASSTPSSPCKSSSPAKAQEVSRKPRLRHPSRLHTRDLTANTFRLYVKHYMDNAPPPFSVSCPSPSRSTCEAAMTPTKHTRNDEGDEPTPRPRPHPDAKETRASSPGAGDEEDEDTKLGFTLSHLRRVPELALLAARIVRAETRKRDKANREKERGKSQMASLLPSGIGAVADPPRKKIKRLFSWAVVKLYEEGSIFLWDGDVRPLPVPPLPLTERGDSQDWGSLWTRGNDTLGTTSNLSHLNASTSVLYTSSASAPLYSHYHAPRRPCDSKQGQESSGYDADADADPASLSDPPADEEAYIPCTPRFLAGHVQEALASRRRPGRAGGSGKEPTPGDVLAHMQRKDARWARLGVWAVEEALKLL